MNEWVKNADLLLLRWADRLLRVFFAAGVVAFLAGHDGLAKGLFLVAVSIVLLCPALRSGIIAMQHYHQNGTPHLLVARTISCCLMMVTIIYGLVNFS